MPATGPHLAIAALCERVLTETDGTISLIRVVDTVTQTASGSDPPEQMPPWIINDLRMVVALKPDQARGRFTLKIIAEDPAGSRVPVGDQDVTLTAGAQGANLVIELAIAIQREGVYWFDVLFGGPRQQEDVLLTRVPLQVVYQRQRVPGQSQAEEAS